jgi:hypothetical protein
MFDQHDDFLKESSCLPYNPMFHSKKRPFPDRW